MAINNTLTLIQAVTVGAGGAASIDFTSIPQTYTDLCVKFSVRCATSANIQQVYIRFNNNSSSIYSNRRLYGYSNAAGSVGATSSSSASINWTSGSSATASTFGSGEMYIPNYAGSSTYKSFYAELASENNSATEAVTGMTAGLFEATTAITQINIIGESNFVQYSTAYLYGVVSAAVGAKATGGNIISQDADYFYHTFTSSGTFTPTQSLTVDTLIVAGGGGGGYFSGGGGGGAGGLQYGTLSVTATGYAVTIGAGGTTPYTSAGAGGDGNNSSFSATYVANGGGGGGGQGALNGRNGGSGGGAATGGSTGGTATQSSTSPLTGYGNNGGSGSNNNAGGGAGSAASVQTVGSGRTYYGVTYATGGRGLDGPATPGTANSGNGAPQGSIGGSGIVIVRYAK
jgi:hypothetical protein